jgi:hypothetical protein
MPDETLRCTAFYLTTTQLLPKQKITVSGIALNANPQLSSNSFLFYASTHGLGAPNVIKSRKSYTLSP